MGFLGSLGRAIMPMGGRNALGVAGGRMNSMQRAASPMMGGMWNKINQRNNQMNMGGGMGPGGLNSGQDMGPKPPGMMKPGGIGPSQPMGGMKPPMDWNSPQGIEEIKRSLGGMLNDTSGPQWDIYNQRKAAGEYGPQQQGQVGPSPDMMNNAMPWMQGGQAGVQGGSIGGPMWGPEGQWRGR